MNRDHSEQGPHRAGTAPQPHTPCLPKAQCPSRCHPQPVPRPSRTRVSRWSPLPCACAPRPALTACGRSNLARRRVSGAGRARGGRARHSAPTAAGSAGPRSRCCSRCLPRIPPLPPSARAPFRPGPAARGSAPCPRGGGTAGAPALPVVMDVAECPCMSLHRAACP